MDFLAPIKRDDTNNLFIYQQDTNLSIFERSQLFFKKIMGYDEHKENLYRALLLKNKNINILLHGAASNGKTIFLNEIERQCHDTIYYDATASSGAGLIQMLYDHRNSVKVLLIDEISELKRNDIDTLRSLLQSGRVSKTLKTLRYDFTIINLKIISTCNNISKLSVPIRTRFQEYLMPEYSDQDFKRILCFCLKRDGIIKNEELANKIGDYLLYNGIRVVRKGVSICSLINEEIDTQEDIKRVIDNQINNSADMNNTNFNIT